MFWKIFLFEIQNRLRRPAIYLYFLAAFIFTAGSFATGSLPVGEKEHINSPYLIAMWCAGITMLMMLVSSFIMGTSLYRDIEYNTKDYYLTYPITKPGYFWGKVPGFVPVHAADRHLNFIRRFYRLEAWPGDGVEGC